MKKLLLTLSALICAGQLFAADAAWMTDLSKAQAKAKEEKKLVFVEFTGSDWCPPCKKLKAEILSSADFAKYAQENLVLVELDFPRAKEQSQDLKDANKALSQKFGIRGFPTVIVFDGEGKELNRQVGFGGGSAKDYIAKLDGLKKK